PGQRRSRLRMECAGEWLSTMTTSARPRQMAALPRSARTRRTVLAQRRWLTMTTERSGVSTRGGEFDRGSTTTVHDAVAMGSVPFGIERYYFVPAWRVKFTQR